MRTIFLADAHLHNPEDKNYRLLLDFIRSLKGTTDILCILGDLFDFRIGLPNLDFPEQEPLLKALEELHSSGTRLIYLEGNHDFKLGNALAERLGAEIYPEPVTLEIQGQKIFLCHGDLINSSDWRYRLLYRILRHNIVFKTGKLLPATIINGLRRRLQRSSKGRYRQDRSRWDYPEMIRLYAGSISKQGCNAMVLGHFHLPFIENKDGFTLISLGDWISQFSYSELVDGKFSLLIYPA